MVHKALKARDPELEVYYCYLGPEARYDGQSRDIAWRGTALYRVPGEEGMFARDITMHAASQERGGWQVHLLDPEKHYAGDARVVEAVGQREHDRTIFEHFTKEMKRPRTAHYVHVYPAGHY
jgi:hypothetical protein